MDFIPQICWSVVVSLHFASSVWVAATGCARQIVTAHDPPTPARVEILDSFSFRCCRADAKAVLPNRTTLADSSATCRKINAETWDRTGDLQIFSHKEARSF